MPPYDELDETRYRTSLRRSQERRTAAGRARRARSRGRAGIAALAGSLLLASSVALASTPTGGAEAGKEPAAKTARVVPLQLGSKGPAVRALQRRLKLKADGLFGPRTRAAVRRFQRRSDLRVTGIADAATLTALGLTAKKAAAKAKPVTGKPATRSESRTLAKIAACESGGDPAAIGGGGRYRGKYQFSYATWETVGGVGDPAAAPEPEQDGRALMLLRERGTQPWPACGA